MSAQAKYTLSGSTGRAVAVLRKAKELREEAYEVLSDFYGESMADAMMDSDPRWKCFLDIREALQGVISDMIHEHLDCIIRKGEEGGEI